MATVSKLSPTGDHSVTGEYDEYTLPNNSYATQFNGSNYLTTGSSSTGITSENFTIECWFYLTGLGNYNGYRVTLLNAAGNGSLNNFSDGGIWVIISGSNSSTATSFAITTSGATLNGPTASATASISLNTWHHFAVSRNGTNFAFWFNGTKLTLNGAVTNPSNNFQPGTLSIGVTTHSTGYLSYFQGYISNFRIVKGTPVYDPTGGNITVPVSHLTAVPGTYLLTCQNPTIIDNSTNGFTITNVGSATTLLPSSNWSKLKSKQYSNGTLQIIGSLDEVTGLTGGVKSRLYSNGSFLVAGTFDEYSNTTVTVQYLVAAGGGGGGGGGGDANFFYGGGGGGAGYLFTGTTTFTRSLYNIVVGTGGAGGAGGTGTRGNNGSNSSVTTGATTVFLAEGGGYGATATGTGGVGGNGGGGGGRGYSPGTATQGYRGGYGNGGTANGYGGGGGGAAAVGNSAGLQPPGGGYTSTGGAGIASTISGASVTYCQGGGGGPGSSGVGPGCGGGGGGGGTWASGGAGAAGKNGIVIFSYPLGLKPPATTTGAVTVTTNGSNSVYTFTGNGTIIFN